MTAAPDLSNAPDQDVVALALQGSEDGFRELLRRYQRRVYDLIYRIVRHPDLAEDLTQETFITVVGALHTHRTESKFSAWVLRIANNRALDHVRQKQLDTVPLGNREDVTPPRRSKASAFQVREPSHSTSGRLDAFRREFEHALTLLKPKARRCFELRHVEGREFGEIARIMNLPETHVRTLAGRARTQLQEILGTKAF